MRSARLLIDSQLVEPVHFLEITSASTNNLLKFYCQKIRIGRLGLQLQGSTSQRYMKSDGHCIQLLDTSTFTFAPEAAIQ